MESADSTTRVMAGLFGIQRQLKTDKIEKKGFTPEEIVAIKASGDFVWYNVKMYALYDVMTLAIYKVEELEEKGLEDDLIKSGMKNDIMAMKQAFERFDKKFRNRYFPDGDCRKEYKRAFDEGLCNNSNNYMEVSEYIDNKVIEEGNIVRDLHKGRMNNGYKGCDTCSLAGHPCMTPIKYQHIMDQIGCLGYVEDKSKIK